MITWNEYADFCKKYNLFSPLLLNATECFLYNGNKMSYLNEVGIYDVKNKCFVMYYKPIYDKNDDMFITDGYSKKTFNNIYDLEKEFQEFLKQCKVLKLKYKKEQIERDFK